MTGDTTVRDVLAAIADGGRTMHAEVAPNDHADIIVGVPTALVLLIHEGKALSGGVVAVNLHPWLVNPVRIIGEEYQP